MDNHYQPLRILVVDDDPVWRKLLRLIIRRHLGRAVQVSVAGNYQKAQAAVCKESYDLVSLDLRLSEAEYGNSYSGRSLLEDIRKESKEPCCGLIILSGFGTEDIAVESLRDYHVDDFIKKSRVSFGDPSVYVAAVKKALLRSLLVRASTAVKDRAVLTISSNRRRLIDAELKAPNRLTKSPKISTRAFDTAYLLASADQIGQRIVCGRKGAWRNAAKKVGRELFDNLRRASPIYDLLVMGRELVAASPRTLQLEFSGPLPNVKIPFELMYDEDYIAFSHMITRNVSEGTRRSERFHEFIERLFAKEKQRGSKPRHLQAIIMGVNTLESTPRCEEEARTIAKSFENNLGLLDVPLDVTLLVGKDATYRNLENRLRDGCHIFHFAGHANYVKSLPEESAIYLFDRRVSAASIRSLFRGKDTQFVFLSCCLSARVEARPGRGDFYGFLDAFYRAGVPTILGYRWPVIDYSANLLAMHFYECLFRNFCPAQSLFQARELAASEIGRDEDVWASPVLFMQN